MKFSLLYFSCCLLILQKVSCQSYKANDFTLTWTNNGDTTDFVLTTDPGSSTANYYYAFGFSNDDDMGEDDVAMCKLNADGTGTVEHYYNSGKSTPSYSGSDKTLGFTKINVNVVNGVVTCSFTRQNKPSQDNSKYFDSNGSYFLLTASGPFTNGGLSYHTKRKSSSSKMSFAAATVSVSYDRKYESNELTLEWKYRDSETDFKITKTGGNNNNYYAFGFSNDNVMGKDDVAVCKVNGDGTGTVEHYYNSGKSTPSYLNSDKTIGFSNIKVSLNNGVLTCEFTRQNSNANVQNYFDTTTNSYYILTATGTITSNLEYHSQNKGVSASIINLQSETNTVATTVQTTSTQATTSTQSTNGPVYTSNQFKLEWVNQVNTTDFKITTSNAVKKRSLGLARAASTNAWYGFGLSNDQNMGDDDVAVCKVNGDGTGTVEHYYNSGKSTPSYLNSDKTIGFSNIKVSLNNGVLTCEFTRQKSMPNIQNYFDISSSSYYILSASGSMSGGSLNYHTSKQSSSSKQNFTSSDAVNAGGEKSDAKKKTHGCLMVFAWMFFASTGIFIARYCKHLLPSKKLCGTKIWFSFHRFLMLQVPLFSIIAFLVILADLDWKWIPTSEATNFTHSIFGIVAIGLAVFQILLALCRPDPAHPQRFIFTWGHRIAGMTIFLFSIVALYLGVTLKEMRLGSNGWGILTGWLIWIVIKDLIVEIFQIVCTSKRADSYTIDNDGLNVADKDTKNVNNFQLFKTVMLILHVIISLAFTIALVVIIGIA